MYNELIVVFLLLASLVIRHMFRVVGKELRVLHGRIGSLEDELLDVQQTLLQHSVEPRWLRRASSSHPPPP